MRASGRYIAYANSFLEPCSDHGELDPPERATEAASVRHLLRLLHELLHRARGRRPTRGAEPLEEPRLVIIMIHRLLLAFVPAALATALTPTPAAQGVGSALPELRLERFAQTEAKTLDDFYGRALLFEFFAYW